MKTLGYALFNEDGSIFAICGTDMGGGLTPLVDRKDAEDIIRQRNGEIARLQRDVCQSKAYPDALHKRIDELEEINTTLKSTLIRETNTVTALGNEILRQTVQIDSLKQALGRKGSVGNSADADKVKGNGPFIGGTVYAVDKIVGDSGSSVVTAPSCGGGVGPKITESATYGPIIWHINSADVPNDEDLARRVNDIVKKQMEDAMRVGGILHKK